jgi:hypothetical protein
MKTKIKRKYNVALAGLEPKYFLNILELDGDFFRAYKCQVTGQLRWLML